MSISRDRAAARAHPWAPKLFLCLRNYNRATLLSDIVAGVTVGLVALPLAMAFAISSGMPPQNGIYCAIFTGFLISALGGSRVQIGGPTGAFVVVVAGIIGKYGVEGLFMCTMMAGVLLVILGLTGMGAAVRFIPRPIVIGFTNGIALLIASTQLKDFLGLTIAHVPGDFTGRIGTLAANMNTVSASAAILAIVSLVAIVVLNRVAPRIPAAIVVLLTGTLIAHAMRLPIETIGTRFGGIPAGLPHPAIPRFSMHLIPTLMIPALTVAMLGAIESLMSAVVADRMIGDRHNSSVELVAQGIANIVSPMFGGLPATGAIARTATNVRSGAKTPVAGMVHALTLVCVLLFAAPLARFIPLSILAAILLVVAYNMGEWKEIPGLLKLTRADIVVWLVTFSLTVLADLTVAVEVGMILAALMYIQKVSNTTTVSQVTGEYVRAARVHILQDKEIPDYVSIFRIHGPFLFGMTDKLLEAVEDMDTLSPIVVLRLRNMTAVDATGMLALEDFANRLHESGRTLLLCGARDQPIQVIRQSALARHLGPENICASIQDALARAEAVYLAGLSALDSEGDFPVIDRAASAAAQRD